MKNRFWAALIAAIFVLSAAAAVIIYTQKSPGRFAEIIQDGVLIRTVDLTVNAEFTVENPAGGYNRIRVNNGAVSVIEASCPDKVCVHQGAISGGAQPIVCLPNKLVVKIIPSSVDEPDLIVG
jgi:hypothetical protein